MRVGIFGGSFDPVHLGHVALCVSLQELHRLDLVYVIPTNISPFKKSAKRTDPKHRLRMCKLAFADVPNTKVLDIEVKKKGVSYTIDTIDLLQEKGYITEKDSLFLLLGQDSYEGISSWKEAKRLLLRVEPIVATRDEKKKGVYTKTPLFDVSSTEIRKRVKLGRFYGHLISKNVYNYIRRYSLYDE